MSHVAYPSAFPVDCVGEIISIIRAGEIVAQKAEFANCVWSLQGYAQSVLIGSPNGPFTALDSGEEKELSRRLNELNAECWKMAQEKQGVASSEMPTAFDWRAALKWFVQNALPILIPLIFSEQT